MLEREKMDIIMNTHAIFKKLLTHGFSEQQAEGITEAISEVKPDPDLYVRKELFEVSETKIHENNSDIATMKGDIQDIKSDNALIKHRLGVIEGDIVELKTNIVELKTDIVELKTDVKSIKTELVNLEDRIDSKINTLELRMDLKMNKLENKMLLLFSGTLVSIIVPIFLKYYG